MTQKNKNSYTVEATVRKQTDGVTSKVMARNNHSNELVRVIMIPKSDTQLDVLSHIAYVTQLTFDDIDYEGQCEFSSSYRLRAIANETVASSILKKGQQFLLLTVPSDIDGLRNVLGYAAYTPEEEDALLQCTLCLYPRQKEVTNDFSYVADTFMLGEIRKCKGGNNKTFMKQLKTLALKQDAATMYRVAEFLYEQKDFGSMLELKLAAADANYSLAVQDLERYAEMLESSEEGDSPLSNNSNNKSNFETKWKII